MGPQAVQAGATSGAKSMRHQTHPGACRQCTLPP